MTTRHAVRYAKALFNSAVKVKQQELLSNFEELLYLCNKIPKLYSFLNSPEISKQQKESLLKVPFKEKPDFLDFLSLLLQKGRFKYLIDITEEYRNIYTSNYGMTHAHLTTAVSLDEGMKKLLKDKLNQIYNKKFELSYDIDPKIIGGGILVIANRMIDFSVKNKLNRLKGLLEGV